MRRLTCLVCAERLEANTLSRCHLLRDEHMMAKHDMYPVKSAGRIVYKPLPERSVLVLGRKPYTDISDLLRRIAECA